MNAANGALLDLPVGNHLRTALEKTRDDYEEILDKLLNLSQRAKRYGYEF